MCRYTYKPLQPVKCIPPATLVIRNRHQINKQRSQEGQCNALTREQQAVSTLNETAAQRGQAMADRHGWTSVNHEQLHQRHQLLWELLET